MRGSKKIITLLIGGVLALPLLTSAATLEDMLQAQINELMQQVAILQARVNQQRGDQIAVVPVTSVITPNSFTAQCINFNRSLRAGTQGSDVIALQAALEQEGLSVSSDERAQGIFGAATAAAVAQFQEMNQNMIPGFADPSARGIFGPQTRNAMNSRRGCGTGTINSVCAPITQIIPSCGPGGRLIAGSRDANGCAMPPRCEFSIPNVFSSGQTCPAFVSPGPNFCAGGRIILSGNDANGCAMPPRCEFSATNTTQTMPVQSCPAFTAPGPDFCKGGTIIPSISTNGCAMPPRCEMPITSTPTTVTTITTITPTQTCPAFTTPGPDFCRGGVIVPSATVNGCAMPPRCELSIITIGR